jgi:hypothetical protein
MMSALPHHYEGCLSSEGVVWIGQTPLLSLQVLNDAGILMSTSRFQKEKCSIFLWPVLPSPSQIDTKRVQGTGNLSCLRCLSWFVGVAWVAFFCQEQAGEDGRFGFYGYWADWDLHNVVQRAESLETQ